MGRQNDLLLTTLLLAPAPGEAALAAEGADSDKRTLLLAGGGYGPGVLDPFARLAGGSTATVYCIPSGRVAIHDDRLHDGRWYYDLPPGTRFDLRTRSIVRP